MTAHAFDDRANRDPFSVTAAHSRGATIHQRAVYAIRDDVAHDLIGGLHIYKHPAEAVRFFTDIANLPNSAIAKHPKDYSLVRLGYLTDSFELVADAAVLLSGDVYFAAQTLGDAP